MSMQARNRKKCVFILPEDFKTEEDPDNNPDRQRMRKKDASPLDKESTQQECLSKAK